jgi:hypothetical protein
MGIFNRFRNPTTDPASTLGPADTLPATTTDMAGRITAGGKDLASKATQIYKENPKLVSGIALVASALLLNRMRGSIK